jgi:hypothetical protein
MTRDELHDLVDALPNESLGPATILLRRAQDPVLAKLDVAPDDDEQPADETISPETAALPTQPPTPQSLPPRSRPSPPRG